MGQLSREGWWLYWLDRYTPVAKIDHCIFISCLE